MKTVCKLILVICIFLSQNILLGESNNLWRLSVKQVEYCVFEIELKIPIQKEFRNKDTLFFSFGGIPGIDDDVEDFHCVTDLSISANEEPVPFIFDKENQTLKIVTKKIANQIIEIKYFFYEVFGTNLGNSNKTTLFCNHLQEKTIPVLKDADKIYMFVTLQTLQGFLPVASVATNSITKIDLRDLNFIFIDTAYYRKASFCAADKNIHIYTMDTLLTTEHIKQLGGSITHCINYFSARIAPYRFHDFYVVDINILFSLLGGSTYCGSFAIIPSSEFYTYTIFHELTHEWVGDIVQKIFGSRGEFLIGESLTEYLKNQFLKYEMGYSVYRTILNNYERAYKKYLTENIDISIMDVTKYVSSMNPIILYKQILLLDTLAQTVGYENLNNNIFSFLKQNINKKITAEQFLIFLREAYQNTHKEAIDKYINSI
jgi:hypothetical protein